jgi:hypothetical protein
VFSVRDPGPIISAATLLEYLHSRRRWTRWREWVSGRRYLPTRFEDRRAPLIVVAHSFRDANGARQLCLAVEQDWVGVPESCRETYDEVLVRTPAIMVVQLRRNNLCGCLGHQHPFVKERPFAESHDALSRVAIGEMDLAYKRVETWQIQPLSDTALDARFREGSRLEEFHKKQFRLKLLSIILHEIHHLVSPKETESVIRARSVAFYHDALAAYVEDATKTLSLTIDRSFYRFG